MASLTQSDCRSGKEKRQILIILVAGIGYLVMASKAIRALRRGHPHSTFYFLTSTEASALAQNYGYLDCVRSFPVRELRKDKGNSLDAMRVINSAPKN